MKLLFQILLSILILGCNSSNTIKNSNSIENLKTKPKWQKCADRKQGTDLCSYINLLTHINKEFKYPPLAKENGIKGEIAVEFQVNKTGKIDTINLLNNLGFGCDEEVVRILKTIPDFIPATRYGENVSVKDTLILRFDGGRRLIDPLYKIANVIPAFGDCGALSSNSEISDCNKKAAHDFFLSHFNYPKQAKRKKIEGYVQVMAVVEKDGKISNAFIMQNLGYGCGEEALRIVNMMPKWKPATHRGKNVRHLYSVLFEFEMVFFASFFN